MPASRTRCSALTLPSADGPLRSDLHTVEIDTPTGRQEISVAYANKLIRGGATLTAHITDRAGVTFDTTLGGPKKKMPAADAANANALIAVIKNANINVAARLAAHQMLRDLYQHTANPNSSAGGSPLNARIKAFLDHAGDQRISTTSERDRTVRDNPTLLRRKLAATIFAPSAARVGALAGAGAMITGAPAVLGLGALAAARLVLNGRNLRATRDAIIDRSKHADLTRALNARTNAGPLGRFAANLDRYATRQHAAAQNAGTDLEAPVLRRSLVNAGVDLLRNTADAFVITADLISDTVHVAKAAHQHRRTGTAADAETKLRRARLATTAAGLGIIVGIGAVAPIPGVIAAGVTARLADAAMDTALTAAAGYVVRAPFTDEGRTTNDDRVAETIDDMRAAQLHLHRATKLWWAANQLRRSAKATPQRTTASAASAGADAATSSTAPTSAAHHPGVDTAVATGRAARVRIDTNRTERQPVTSNGTQAAGQAGAASANTTSTGAPVAGAAAVGAAAAGAVVVGAALAAAADHPGSVSHTDATFDPWEHYSNVAATAPEPDAAPTSATPEYDLFGDLY